VFSPFFLRDECHYICITKKFNIMSSNLSDHLIDRAQADLLEKEYENSNYLMINNSRQPDKPESKYYTYDLEVLQDYINFAREEMEKLGIKKKGIRISMGKYPQRGFDARLDAKFNGYQTVFISAENLDTSRNIIQNEEINNITDRGMGVSGIPSMDLSMPSPPH
jgi:hypothetical protein